jgi:hypothetical protein
MRMTVYMKVAVFWDVMLHIRVHMFECFKELSVSSGQKKEDGGTMLL